MPPEPSRASASSVFIHGFQAVSVMSGRTHAVPATIPVGGQPRDVAVDDRTHMESTAILSPRESVVAVVVACLEYLHFLVIGPVDQPVLIIDPA